MTYEPWAFVILGVVAAVCVVVFVFIEIGLRQGVNHVIGGLPLSQCGDRDGWADRAVRACLSFGADVRGAMATFCPKTRTVYCRMIRRRSFEERLYAEKHPRIYAYRKLAK